MARRRHRSACPPRSKTGQRGFTLIELMIAMLIGSLLITLVFAIYTKMSVAYRTQSVLSETQQTLRTARETIVSDVRQAGFMIPNGVFRVGGELAAPVGPLEIANDTTAGGADQLRVYYADSSARAAVVRLGASSGVVEDAEVDDLDEFAVGDVIVITAPISTQRSSTDKTDIVQYAVACVVAITATTPPPNPTIEFDASDVVHNATNNPHCAQLQDGSANSTRAGTMVYRFASRAYRIDPNRLDLGVLQRAIVPVDAILDADWEDLAFGFTDIQVASRWFEPGNAVDVDADGDPERDWYSTDNQEPGDASRPADGVPMQLTLSLVARTLREVDTASTAQTPAFIDTNEPDHNQLGDHASEPVTGSFLYRFTTSRVDIRNLGVGR